MSAAALVVSNVTKRFGSHQAVADVSLDIAVGAAVVVLGPSGCGKTTLLRLIAGLEVPDDGEILLNGTRVAAFGRSRVPPHQRGLGFVFQDLALWPHLTVWKNLDFVPGSVKTPRGEHGRLATHDRTVQPERLRSMPSAARRWTVWRVTARAVILNIRSLLLHFLSAVNATT